MNGEDKTGFKQVPRVVCRVLYRRRSTEKRPKAGRANFQHRGHIEKGNK